VAGTHQVPHRLGGAGCLVRVNNVGHESRERGNSAGLGQDRRRVNQTRLAHHRGGIDFGFDPELVWNQKDKLEKQLRAIGTGH